MPGNPGYTVYVGNLDEKVNDRVLYEILIQAGRIVDMYIPRDKETGRHKGYAFAEYETEEIAQYAVKLFSGLVTLHNKTLRFAISGQDKPTRNAATPVTPMSNSPSLPRSPPIQPSKMETLQQPLQILTPCRFSAHHQPVTPNYSQVTSPGSVGNGYRSELNYSSSCDYNNNSHGRFFGASRSGQVPPQYNSGHPVAYPSY